VSDREALLQASLDDPANDAPRLVFADWQEEHGQAAHAELIRVQCELARLERKDPARRAALRAREKELLALPELSDVLRRWVKYERGFIVDYHTGTEGLDPPEHEQDEDLQLPFDRVLTLWFSFGQGACPTERYMRWLAGRPWLARVSHLQFFESYVQPEPLRALAASPHLKNVRRIECCDASIAAEAIADLVLASAIRRLEALNLSGWFTLGDELTPISTADHPAVNAAVRQIVSSPRVAHLQTLNVGAIGVGPEGASAILESPHLARLKELFLEGAHCVPEEVRRALRQRFGAKVRFSGADSSCIE
jgi:uncharacterized protein (TIGR02996 family)